MTPSDTPSPYVGLQPFREEDYPYFFGRERDIRVISSNFREQPLTIVYGASGVGKSSVLRAGVLPHLRADSGAVAVYYNTWQSDSFLEDLTGRCRTALGLNDPEVRLDKLVASGERRLFLLLDQFEELLLYHQSGAQAEEFDSLLARIVNRSDLSANALIGIREDALSRFDQRFSIRIADLLANTLPLEHLNNDAARRAILEPLRVFNERHGLGANGYSMEPELAEEILHQVQPRQFAEAEVEGAIPPGPGRVETPFLQLVLQRLWKETKADSLVLRLETLRRIGGAVQIVDKHVNDVLASLPRDRDREIAAKMFRYLVTPSRSKIAQDMESLVGYGEAPEAEVRPVLSWLSDKPESRTLRRLDSPERYEIFHDVLAQPILDWRKKYFAERERIEEVRKRRRLQLLAGAMVLLALVAMCFALIAFDQRRKAREAADLARIENQRTMAAKNEVQAAHAQADATANALQAKQAELAGRTEEAAKFRAAADDATKQAQNYSKSAEAERNKAAGLLEGKDSNYQDAVQQIANLRSERDQLQSRVTSLSTEVEQLRKQLGEKGNPVSQVPQAQQPQPKPALTVKPPETPASSIENLFYTPKDRLAAIQAASIFAPKAVSDVNILQGPEQNPKKFQFHPDDKVVCDFQTPGSYMGGKTPKFACKITRVESVNGQVQTLTADMDEEPVLVEFGANHSEAYAYIVATRLMWALGYYADSWFPVRVECHNCPDNPVTGSGAVGTKTFYPATIPRKFPWHEMTEEGKEDEGWSWKELDTVNGRPTYERDGLKLLAAFMQHSDNKPVQQRLDCQNVHVDMKTRPYTTTCDKSVMLVEDVGATFGTGDASSKMNFKGWSSLKLWNKVGTDAAPQQCQAVLHKGSTARDGLSDPMISEEGRRFDAGLMCQLSDHQIEDLFRASRAAEMPEYHNSDGSFKAGITEASVMQQWVKAFKQKREELAKGRCEWKEKPANLAAIDNPMGLATVPNHCTASPH